MYMMIFNINIMAIVSVVSLCLENKDSILVYQ